jgi:histone H3/H4
VLGRKTPEEVFTRRKLEVGHFRIFGCLVYCQVPSEKRTKLEATTKKGIFIGYSETSKAYRVCIPSLRNTVVRRDVKLEEDRALRKAYRVCIPSLRKTVVRRDVKLEEDRALRKAHDTGAAAAGDQELETQKIEDTQVTSASTSTGVGTNVQTADHDKEKEAPLV